MSHLLYIFIVMQSVTIESTARVFATVTLSNDNGDQVKVNPTHMQTCGSGYLIQQLHAVQNEENPRIKVNYDNMVALRDAIHYCAINTRGASPEDVLPMLQTAIYFNFTNFDVSHILQQTLFSLSKTIHASLLHHVICCKSPHGTNARDFCLRYALPVCKHNFHQMPSEHITPQVLDLIADQDDLCLASESQLAKAIVLADCPHLLQHVRLDQIGHPVAHLSQRTGFLVSSSTKHIRYNGVHVDIVFQGFYFEMQTFLTNGFHMKLAVPVTCVSSRHNMAARQYQSQSLHTVALHARDKDVHVWIY